MMKDHGIKGIEGSRGSRDQGDRGIKGIEGSKGSRDRGIKGIEGSKGIGFALPRRGINLIARGLCPPTGGYKPLEKMTE